MIGILWEHSPIPFLVITLALGGGAAWKTGQAVAQGWTNPAIMLVYAALLAGAARFLHYALGEGALLSPWFLSVDYAILLAIAALAFRVERAAQMTTQYFWLYKRTSPLTWREVAERTKSES